MTAKFKSPIVIGGVLYQKGFHQVDGKVQADWYFKACVKSKMIEIQESKLVAKEIPEEEAPTEEAPVKKKGKAKE